MFDCASTVYCTLQGVLDQELDAVMFGLQTASEDARHWHKQKEAAGMVQLL